MNKIGEDVKAYIVEGLACYMTPSKVAEAVKLDFNVEVSRQQVAAYDPTKAQGKRLSEDLTNMFHVKRKEYNRDLTTIPLASLAYRMNTLNRMVDHAIEAKNMPLAASLIEQAAKDMGGIYSNALKIDQYPKTDDDGEGGNDGINLEALSDEDLRKVIEIIDKAEGDKTGTSPP